AAPSLPLSQSGGAPRQPVGGEVVWVNGTDSAVRSRDNRRGLFQCFDGSLALTGPLDLRQPSVELGSRLIIVPDMKPCDVCVAHHGDGWRVLAHGCLLIVIHRSPYPFQVRPVCMSTCRGSRVVCSTSSEQDATMRPLLSTARAGQNTLLTARPNTEMRGSRPERTPPPQSHPTPG